MSTESSSTTTAAPAASSASTQEAPVSQEEILKIFREMLSQREMVIQKISEMEAELSEYTRVHNTIADMDTNRKAYQFINGILTERTLGELVPIVKSNRDAIDEVMKNLYERLKKLSDEIAIYRTKYGIRIMKPGESV